MVNYHYFFIIVVFAWRIFLEVLKLAFFYSSKKKFNEQFCLNFPQMFLSNVCVENTTKRMLWRIIHTLESKSKEGGAEMIVLYFERL